MQLDTVKVIDNQESPLCQRSSQSQRLEYVRAVVQGLNSLPLLERYQE